MERRIHLSCMRAPGAPAAMRVDDRCGFIPGGLQGRLDLA